VSGDRGEGGEIGGDRVGGKLLTEPVFPDAGVVRTDCPDGDCAERQPLPEAVAKTPAEKKTPAQWAYERLILYVQKFEEGLDSEHEVGMVFAGSEAGTLNIRGMGYFGPDIITFYGVDQHGTKTQLVQHVSQLNVMLKAMPKMHDKAERIGFQMRSRLEEEAATERS
jgi:hypothetical protein